MIFNRIFSLLPGKIHAEYKPADRTFTPATRGAMRLHSKYGTWSCKLLVNIGSSMHLSGGTVEYIFY